MSATASQVFEFLAAAREFSAERNEFALPEFTMLRRGLRSVIVRLQEEDLGYETNEIANRLRSALLEWLTVPVPFDSKIVETVKCLGDAALVERRWGKEVRSGYEMACQGADALQAKENPARTCIREVIRDLRVRGKSFKIYSHPRARPHFESIFVGTADHNLSDADFLSNVREYRESEPFDTLVKMGPLRAWGWGSAPDAIVSAPRFNHLAQFVWSGTSDEPGFGYDPVNSPIASHETPQNSESNKDSFLSHCISWLPKTVNRIGKFDALGDPVEDEFKIFQRDRDITPGEKRHATLVIVNDRNGILYAPQSPIFSFDPVAKVGLQIEQRVLGETLFAGMFVILPVIGDAGLGMDQANEGHYSRIWKNRLKEELAKNLDEICRFLESKGVDFINLPGCLEYWARPATTVIHAPQQRWHFKILIDALAMDFRSANGEEWWKLAWNEIRRSRGDAIQAGFHEHELVDEQLLSILRKMEKEIRGQALGKTYFTLSLPNDADLRGSLVFFKVDSIEEGFLAPGSELKSVKDLNNIEQWRI